MATLKVNIEIAGYPTHVGDLVYAYGKEPVFKYAEAYLCSTNPLSISLSLPLQDKPFTAAQTKNFFDGLLPEGFTRRAVAQWLRVDENDYVSILKGLGAECLGAVQIVDEDYQETSRYEPLSLTEVQALANEGATKSAAIMTETHLSLAGASGKVGLYYDASKARWLLPKGLAPSTHIVKQSHIRLQNIIANEQLALMTAKKLGINTADSFIVNLADGEDANVLLASKRYDRTIQGTVKTIDGLPCPLRLHQEDFAQALGISSASKYESAQDGYLVKIFDLLRKFSANPLEDRVELWRRIVFNYLVGNTDGHIKNFSLLYSSDLQSVRLAPAYDIISTTVYKQSTRNMSLYVAGENLLDKLTKSNFSQAAKDIGLGKRLAEGVFDEMTNSFEESLQYAAHKLNENGFKNAKNIAEQILRTGGIANCK